MRPLLTAWEWAQLVDVRNCHLSHRHPLQTLATAMTKFQGWAR